MTPLRSAPRSPSKASELNFRISKTFEKRMDGRTSGNYVNICTIIGGHCGPPNPCFQSHMSRTTITDMQAKCCGDCYDIYLIQSQYKGNHKRESAVVRCATSFVVAAKGRQLCILAFNKVNIVAVPTILVLQVGTVWSEHV